MVASSVVVLPLALLVHPGVSCLGGAVAAARVDASAQALVRALKELLAAA